jgi:hypothetical protein
MQAHAVPEHATAIEPHPIRAAMEARDREAIAELLAPDVNLFSPLIGVPFRGRAPVAVLLELIAESFERWQTVEEFRSGDRHVIVTRARIGGRDVDLVEVLAHDEHGRIREFRVHGRPMSAVAAFGAVIGPRLARRRGRARAALVRALTAPLPGLLALGDRTVARLAMPRS